LAAFKLTHERNGRLKLQYMEQVDFEEVKIPTFVGRVYALSLLASFRQFKEGIEVRWGCSLSLNCQ
jgi:hypothetical protein